LAAIAPGILEVADEFLLLGVDRDRRVACGKRRLHAIVDVAELGIAIGWLDPSRVLRLDCRR
jgi:hypothetical protein